MAKRKGNNVKIGQQGTKRPWERPGQSSQDRKVKMPTRRDRAREQRHNETS